MNPRRAPYFLHEDDAVGNSLEVHRELAEGIGSLPGWCKGVRRKKTETRRKIVMVGERLVGSREGSKERGGWPQPSPLQGWPTTAKVPYKGATDCSLDSPRQRLLGRGSRPRLACGRSCQRWAVAHGQTTEATAHRGDTYGHGAHRRAAYGQKLLPAMAVARKNARRGGAHGGAAHGRGADRKGSSTRPLAERLSAGKGCAGSDSGVEGGKKG
ncbi:hypothetical protein GW17_00023681 [Ensete ventricosum]|nr:hypothetical protein GW17_00023681 [Ensete ventricosum]